MMDFKDKKVLVTGGSRGIGAACVKMFAERNAAVAFTYNTGYDGARSLMDIFPLAKGFRINLFDGGDIQKLIREIHKELDGIDILVNNAGVWKHAPVDKMTDEQWNETIKINLTASFMFTRSAIPFMKEKKYGRIINITSTAGQRGEPYYSHYAASKGALISFTKSLAAELGEYNITVNSVAPGWVITDMTNGVFSNDEYKEKVRNEIPLRRIATAEDIGGPVVFLASDLARHITGEILNVNGGSVLCG